MAEHKGKISPPGCATLLVAAAGASQATNISGAAVKPGHANNKIWQFLIRCGSGVTKVPQRQLEFTRACHTKPRSHRTQEDAGRLLQASLQRRSSTYRRGCPSIFSMFEQHPLSCFEHHLGGAFERVTCLLHGVHHRPSQLRRQAKNSWWVKNPTTEVDSFGNF